MNTINHSFSIPREEFENLTSIRDKCKNAIERPNLTEIVRVAIHDIEKKEPLEISRTLEKIGRKKPGRERRKEKIEPPANNELLPTDIQWNKIKKQFEDIEVERAILTEILFDLRYKWRRDVPKSSSIPAVTKWRRLKKWKETGIWAKICRIILQSLSGDEKAFWSGILLESYLSERGETK